jgi:hypothetical protein
MQTKTITEQPARVAGEIARRIATQERRAEKTRQRVRRLREKASAEIERLIAFMDATDGYTMDEREPNGDEADASYREGWMHIGSPMEDDEDDGGGEPSLGAPEYHPAGYIMMGGEANQERWAQGKDDGRERDDADDPKGELVNEDGDGNPDDEPSLGWCENMCQTVPNTSVAGCDLELQDHSRPQPQNRTNLGTTLSVDPSYRRFVHGLTDSQRKAVRARMRQDSSVVLR